MDDRSYDAFAESVIITDLEGRVVLWNRATEKMFGWKAAEAIGRPVVEVTSSQLPFEQTTQMMARLARDETWDGEISSRHRDGNAIRAQVICAPHYDEDGKLVGVIRISEIVESQPANQRVALFAEIGRVISSSLLPEQAATAVARFLVPTLSDLCLVVVMDSPNGPQRIAWAACDAESTTLVDSLRTASIDPRARDIAETALRTGRALFIPDYTAHLSSDRSAGPEYDAFVRLGPRATIVAPLIARGKSFGVVTLSMIHRSGREFASHDIDAAEQIGHLLGLVLANARLSDEVDISAQQLRLALSTAPIRVFTQDAQLRYTLIQGGGRTSVADALGKTDLELWSPTDAEPVVKMKRQVLATGIGARAIVAVTAADGICHYDQLIEPVHDATGSVVGLTGVSWDVTEQYRTIEKLRIAETRARSLIEDAIEPYFLRDLDGRYADVNAALCALLGYTHEEILAMDGSELVMPEDQARFAVARAETAIGWESTNEWRLRCKSGELVDVEIKTKILADGRRQGFVRDVTERTRIARALEQSRADQTRLRRRFETLDKLSLALISALAQPSSDALRLFFDLIVRKTQHILDAEFVALGIGTDPTQPFSTWVQYGIDPAVAATMGPAPRPVGLLGEVQRRGRSIRTTGPRVAPERIDMPANHPEVRNFLGTPIPFRGKSVGNLYITNKRGAAEFSADDQYLAEQLAIRVGIGIELARLYEEMNTAVRARDNLLAIVSHDLQSPLLAINLAATLITDTMPNAAPALTRSVSTILRAADRMGNLIENLVSAAAIDSGTFTLAPNSQDVHELMDELLLLLEPIAKNRSIQLELHLPTTLPSIWCDRAGILQVLTNLAGNAVKFSPVRSAVEFHASADSDFVTLAVVDHGPGIASEQLPRLFERFWKGNDVRQNGVGLGLFIAQGIVAAHGGKIWVESTLGSGCRFSFSIPTVAQERNKTT